MGRVATNLPYKSILYLLSGKYSKMVTLKNLRIFYFQIYSTAFSVRAKKIPERLAMIRPDQRIKFTSKGFTKGWLYPNL